MKQQYYLDSELRRLDTLDQLLSQEAIKTEDLNLLHRIATSDKAIIGTNGEFGNQLTKRKVVKTVDEETGRETSHKVPLTEEEMRQDIASIIASRNQAIKPLSLTMIAGIKKDICTNQLGAQRKTLNLALSNEQLNEEEKKDREDQIKRLENLAKIYEAKQYIYQIVDERYTPTQTPVIFSLYDKLEKIISKQDAEKLTETLNTKDNIFSMNAVELNSMKTDLGNAYTQDLRLRNDIEFYVADITKAAKNPSKSTAIAEITQLNVDFMKKHSTLDKTSLETAKQEAINLVSKTGLEREGWLYVAKQCLKSMVGKSDAQKIDKAFADLAAKGVAKANIMIEDVKTAGGPSLARAAITDSKDKQRGGH